jgi:polar amino acid transport system substrate-binding protein
MGDAATPPTENLLEIGRKQGYLRVGFNENPPLSYIDPTNGKLTGAGPVLLGAMLKSLGIPTIYPTICDFDAIIPGLLDGRWDISGLAFDIIPTRCSQVAFTNPVNAYPEGALVQSGNPYKIHSYTDIANNPKLLVAIQEGDAEIQYAEACGIKKSQIVLFTAEALAETALKEGRVQVYLNGTFSLESDLKTYGSRGIELAVPFTGPVIDGKVVVSYAGWALRYSDISAVKSLNAEIAKYRASGELLKLERPFGFTADTIPAANITARLLCPASPLP